MTIKDICRKLASEGMETELTRVSFGNETRQACWVKHDYTGFYPKAETFAAHEKAAKLARKHGYTAEPRGNYISTLIY